MRIRKHPNLDLWCREDGAVLMPPCRKFPKFRWTFGSDKGKGYMEVGFRGKVYTVHRLVAQTFLDNPLNLPTVDHYPDRTPSNNAASNLRWADRKMQNNNRRVCEDSLERYGVRRCEDINAYRRSLYANDPEYAERQRASNREYEAKQRALGRRYRRCPDGKHRYLTDSEFAAMFP